MLFTSQEPRPANSVMEASVDSMTATRPFLLIGLHSWRGRGIDWCTGRGDIVY